MTADARSIPRAEGARNNGDMLWFNNEKGHGFIETEAGERLRVEGPDFRNGPPEGRVAGMPVTVSARPSGVPGLAPPLLWAARSPESRALVQGAARPPVGLRA